MFITCSSCIKNRKNCQICIVCHFHIALLISVTCSGILSLTYVYTNWSKEAGDCYGKLPCWSSACWFQTDGAICALWWLCSAIAYVAVTKCHQQLNKIFNFYPNYNPEISKGHYKKTLQYVHETWYNPVWLACACYKCTYGFHTANWGLFFF